MKPDPFEPHPSPGVAAVTAYRVPPPPFPTDLRLDGTRGGEIADGLSDALAGLDVSVWSRYPDPAPLEEAIAARHAVDSSRVVVTAGADEALDRACRALLAPGKRFVLPVPTFEMIPRYARLAEAEIVEVPWHAANWPLERVLGRSRDGADAVAVVSPNNPTGSVGGRDDLRSLAAALRGHAASPRPRVRGVRRRRPDRRGARDAAGDRLPDLFEGVGASRSARGLRDRRPAHRRLDTGGRGTLPGLVRRPLARRFVAGARGGGDARLRFPGARGAVLPGAPPGGAARPGGGRCVVAVPMEHSARDVAESIAHLLRRCTRPVLFVPA